MIAQVFSESEFSALPKRGIEAQKIRAMLLAYGTKLEFCRFYRQDNCYLAKLDGSLVLYTDDTADYAELAAFLSMSGFSEIFCSTRAAEDLCQQASFKRHDINLMVFRGQPKKADVDYSPPLSDVFDLLKTSFDIEFEPWYLDMSHRIRHGVTRCAVLDGACLCVQHDLNGEALLSQISTPPQLRRQGRAARLIKAVCGELAPSEVFVLCEDGLVQFYKHIGFEPCGINSVLTR